MCKNLVVLLLKRVIKVSQHPLYQFVCVIFTAQKDGPILTKLSTNDLPEICKFFLTGFSYFKNNYVMVAILYYLHF